VTPTRCDGISASWLSSLHLDQGGVRDSQLLTSLQWNDPLGSLSRPAEQRIEPAYSLVRAVLEQPAIAGQSEGDIVVTGPLGDLAHVATRRHGWGSLARTQDQANQIVQDLIDEKPS
jgi:hypothetical protein